MSNLLNPLTTLTLFGAILVFVVIIVVITFAVVKFYFARPLELPSPLYPEAQWAEVEGFKIRYMQFGDPTKPALVGIHGLASSMYVWRFLLPDLSRHYHFTIFDLPGFGESDKHVDQSYSLDDQCRRLFALLDHLQITSCSLIAHSMGATISLGLAQLLPQRFEKLILLAPALDPDVVKINPKLLAWSSGWLQSFIVTPRLVRWAYPTIHFKGQQYEEALLHYYRPYHRSKPAVITFIKHLELLRDPRPSQKSDVKVPTLLLYSRKDNLYREKALQRYLKNHPHVEAYEVENSSHQITEDLAPKVLEHILRFSGLTS